MMTYENSNETEKKNNNKTIPKLTKALKFEFFLA